MNAITKHEAAALPALQMNEAELIEVLTTSLYPGASVSALRLVLGYCKAAGLDPMQKPVHIVPMWDGKAKAMRDVVMPGVGLYRTQAARTSSHMGSTEPEFGPDVTENLGGMTVTYPKWCKVVTKRRLPTGEVAEHTAIEFWKENYAVKGGADKSIAPNAMWTKRPYGQIAKCAEAQSLRKAFPEVGSAPTADEMEGKPMQESEVIDGATGEITQRPAAERTEPPVWPEENFKAQFARWSKAIEQGMKTHDDILAMARTRGTLTEAQEKQIRAVRVVTTTVTDVAPKTQPAAQQTQPADMAPPAADMAGHADFLAGMGQ